jgi:hypothetical protein
VPGKTAPVSATPSGNDPKPTGTIDAGGQSMTLVFTPKIGAAKIDESIDFARQGQHTV